MSTRGLKSITLIIILVCLIVLAYLKATNKWPFVERVYIEPVIINSDKDNDGVLDLQDIVNGALQEIKNKPRYKSVYYAGGYPPANEGVCTDLVWRAFKHAGYDLKDMVDSDIENNTELYYRVIEFGGPDPNIDFRRVQNLDVFFSRYAESLTTEINPDDIDNLSQWQGGDIVCFKNHIGIVSNKRNYNGVPLLIHHGSRYPNEGNYLIRSTDKITGHYRFPKVTN